MGRKAVSGIMLALLLISMLTLAFDIQPVKADYVWNETIYIRADGSVEPAGVPISTVDNVTYALTDNIIGNVPVSSSAVVVQRDSIVVQGAGYTVQGIGADYSKGIYLFGVSNVTIIETNIKNFFYGVCLELSSHNSIFGNNITNNGVGIYLAWNDSSNNIISGNNITDNGAGIFIKGSYNNITDNLIDSNGRGIHLTEHSPYNFIAYNRITSQGGCGIELMGYSDNNIIQGNYISNSSGITYPGFGIRIGSAHNNLITKNLLEKNAGPGVFINCAWWEVSPGVIEGESSQNNRVYQNTFVMNEYGVKIEDDWDHSTNIFYHNNFINNTVSQALDPWINYWDNGYPSGGNYWSDYNGTDIYSGLYQNETNSDGIGDAPYTIDENNRDNYPLIQPYHGPVRNLNTGQSYPTIQEGINNANEEDRIFVLSGTYFEHVVANKTISLVGENRSNTFIDGNGTGTVVHIVSDNVTISGFTIQNGGTIWPGSSIWLDQSHHCTINKNIIRNNYWYGIYLRNCRLIAIDENVVTNNEKGIWIVSSNNCTVKANIAMENSRGIQLQASRYCLVIGNTASNNTYDGIVLSQCDSNDVCRNSVSGNNVGIKLENNLDVGSTVKENTINKNNIGVGVYATQGNIIYNNNFLNNTQQVYVYYYGEYYPDNTWDDSYPSAGNYWNDYTGIDFFSGISQNITGSDGIGDTPYAIDANNRDNYPLMKPYPWGCDVNADGIVDITDAYLIALAFGIIQSDPRYNLHLDMNSDGIIDISDIYTVAIHYGEIDP